MSDSVGEAALRDEAALLDRAQAGDLAAFDDLVRRHQREVFAVALRMLGDRDEAEDVAQDAFVRAYRALGRFRRDAKLSTWLVSITMNLCRNRRRWWARRRRVIIASVDDPVDTPEGSVAHEVVDPSPTPLMSAQRHEQAARLAGLLQQLDATSRAVIVLRDVHGYSYDEVADTLHLRVGTVKSRLSRARLQLRALLERSAQ